MPCFMYCPAEIKTFLRDDGETRQASRKDATLITGAWILLIDSLNQGEPEGPDFGPWGQ